MLCKQLNNFAGVLIFMVMLTEMSLAQAPEADEAVDVAQPKILLPQPLLRAAMVAPARFSRLPQLSDLAQVKLVTLEGEKQLVMMLESFRSEKQVGMVTKARQEIRTRKVVDAEGNVVQQDFTVTVPYVEEGEVELKIPAGRKPVTRPASQFRFFDLRGQELQLAEASEKLSSLRPAFLLDRFAGELPELPELSLEVLNPDCLVIVCEDPVREDTSPPVFEAIPARDLRLRAIEP